ncbi:hypothetical protein [Microviridae sp.]|nr:hypothetical protein [Microviridae sp.]
MAYELAYHQVLDQKTGELVKKDQMFVEVDGKDCPVYEDVQPNGDIQYLLKVVDDHGHEYFKRCPKHVLDQVHGREIVSDVALFTDAEIYQPSIQEMIARFEGVRSDGFYDGDVDDADMALDGEIITDFEERTEIAVKRLNELREQKGKARADKVQKADDDMVTERAEADDSVIQSDTIEEKPVA